MLARSASALSASVASRIIRGLPALSHDTLRLVVQDVAKPPNFPQRVDNSLVRRVLQMRIDGGVDLKEAEEILCGHSKDAGGGQVPVVHIAQPQGNTFANGVGQFWKIIVAGGPIGIISLRRRGLALNWMELSSPAGCSM